MQAPGSLNRSSNACDACGSVLNDGSTGWVLEDVLSSLSPAGEASMRV